MNPYLSTESFKRKLLAKKVEKTKANTLIKDWIVLCLESLNPTQYQIFNRKYWVWVVEHTVEPETLQTRVQDMIQRLDTTLYHSAIAGEKNPAITSAEAGIDMDLIDWESFSLWLSEKLQGTKDSDKKATVYTEFDLWGNPVRSTFVVDNEQGRQTLLFAGNQAVCQQLDLGL